MINTKKLNALITSIENDTDLSAEIAGDYLYISFQGAGNCYGGIQEDYSIEIDLENKTVEEVIQEIMDSYNNWDMEEHVEMWANARYTTNRKDKFGIPLVTRLVEEADAIGECYENLYDCVNKFDCAA